MGLYSSIDLVYDSDIVMGTIPVPEYGKKKKKKSRPWGAQYHISLIKYWGVKWKIKITNFRYGAWRLVGKSCYSTPFGVDLAHIVSQFSTEQALSKLWRAYFIRVPVVHLCISILYKTMTQSCVLFPFLAFEKQQDLFWHALQAPLSNISYSEEPLTFPCLIFSTGWMMWDFLSDIFLKTAGF